MKNQQLSPEDNLFIAPLRTRANWIYLRGRKFIPRKGISVNTMRLTQVFHTFRLILIRYADSRIDAARPARPIPFS
jgi:hypothetical protein